MNLVSIVIPVYKNAPTLAALHARLTAVLHALHVEYEILFVNDACPAGSAAVLRALVDQDARVAALLLVENVGQNRAVLAGLSHARGDVVVVMDADLQDPPEAIPALLGALTGDAAAVFGGRRGRYESATRLVTSWLFKRSLYLLSAGRIPPDAGLFVAMRRPMISKLLAFRVAQPYVVGLMGRTRLPLRSVPVLRHANDERESTYTSGMRLTVAWRAIRQMLPLPRQAIQGSWQDQLPLVIEEYLGARFNPVASAWGAASCAA